MCIRDLPLRLLPALLVLPLASCVVRPMEKPRAQLEKQCNSLTPQFLDKEVDILFVIDNSESMRQEQKNLAQQFPRLIGALRSPRLGGKLPNIRIGVVSTDLGAGNSSDVCSPGGDRARLQHQPRGDNCAASPKDRWISYHEGKTNVRNATSADAVTQVQQAFSCVAQLGIGGCGFEQPLEVARQALDPALNVNPGFFRNDPANNRDALLAVIFITDEDDCSAADPQIFARNNSSFGPFTSYRCFSHGVTCKCPGGKCSESALGPRSDCRPGGKHLHSVERYVQFFKNLKKTPDGKSNYRRVIMAAIAGDTDKVNVVLEDGHPTVNTRCRNGFPAKAAPAIRIRSLVHAFAHELSASEVSEIKARRRQIPHFIDAQGRYREENFTTICSSDFSTALERIGKTIVANLGTLCLDPPLTDQGSVICQAGDQLGKNHQGQQVTCEQSCLDRARFVVHEISTAGRSSLPKCPARLFDPAINSKQCGDACPCWRVIPHSSCRAQQGKGQGASPYAVQIMRPGPAPKGTYLDVASACSASSWGSAELASSPQCY